MDEMLSSDLAFRDFLVTRQPWKVRMESPDRVRWPRKRLAQFLYEEETEQMRGVLVRTKGDL